MAHHSVRFPIDIALGAQGGPVRSTDIVTLVSGVEERNQRWFASRRQFDARYGVKNRSDMREVLDFFEERRGRFHSFLWHDAIDFSTAKTDAVLSAFDEVIGQGDGSTTSFQLVKSYGASFDPYARKITKPVTATLQVAVNAVTLSAPDFSVNVETGMVTLLSAPALGHAITAGFEFDIPVRFETDRLDIALNSFDAADIPSIPVIEVHA